MPAARDSSRVGMLGGQTKPRRGEIQRLTGIAASAAMIDAMFADAHTDLLLELAHREHRLGETDVFAQTWLPLLTAGGVGLQVCPIFVALDRQPEGALREALGQATSFVRATRETSDRVVAVRSLADLDAVERGER